MTGERGPSDPSASRDLPDPPEDVIVDQASPDDRLDVLRILDAAMLETDADAVDDRIAAADALVARSTRTGGVVGALVATRPEPNRLHVDAVAVRRARRGEGIGSALVAAAVYRGESDPAVESVTTAFDADLAAFYEALGFDICLVRSGTERSTLDPLGDPDRSEARFQGRLSVSSCGRS